MAQLRRGDRRVEADAGTALAYPYARDVVIRSAITYVSTDTPSGDDV